MECDQWRRGLSYCSLRWLVAISLFALVMGVCNILVSHPLQSRGLLEEILSGQGDYMTYLVTLLIWGQGPGWTLTSLKGNLSSVAPTCPRKNTVKE